MVLRASGSHSVARFKLFCRVIPKTLILAFTDLLLDVGNRRDVEGEI